MQKLSSSKRRLLDEFSRQLDKVERRVPMQGGYERLTPYIVDRREGGQSFEFICYHKESAAWFDRECAAENLTLMHRHAFVKPGDVVFDIGCNSGYLTVWFALMVGEKGRVLAFDPYPWNILATTYNARLNYLDNVRPHEVGLSDSSFELALPLDAARTVDGLSSKSVRACVADIREYAHERPTFLKIDIEGGEYELARADLHELPHVERIILELHPQFIEDRGLDTRAVLRAYSRQGFELRHDHPLNAEVDAEATATLRGQWYLKRRGTKAVACNGMASA
jgi:FkbM family methyltransferase